MTGEQIRQIRVQMGLTQDAFVKIIGMHSSSYLSTVENGKRSVSARMQLTIEKHLESSNDHHSTGANLSNHKPHRQVHSFIKPSLRPNYVRTQLEILKCMRDLNEFADDTIWISRFETVFERLSGIFIDAGGSMAVLRQTFPEYYETPSPPTEGTKA